MRLSQIKLAGFKSFVDPSTLPLPSNLTSVVGPNGCGKSNLIDAVRWVLGESSMKQLRSSSSEDVIFNGSRSRKPVGRASVELSFDNADHTLQGPFAHYAEVSVRRELTRDGSSQYFLNGAKCLRRDVVDLFLGTGLGARSGYAIIEQGMVSRMIEARPEELRQWLEEAAGISKYRERRRETESRIRSTRENLSRVDDLCGEVRARARALEKQADNARKYKELRSTEQRLKIELHYLATRDTEARAAEAGETVTGAEQAQREARVAVTEAEGARLAAEADLEAARKHFGEVQSAHYAAEAERARAEQSLRHARELAEMRNRELHQLDEEQQRAHSRMESARQQATEAAERERALGAEREAAQQALERAERRAEAAEAALESASQALQSHDEASREPLSRLAGDSARLREKQQALEGLSRRLDKLRADLQNTPEPDPETVAKAQKAAAEAATTLERARAQSRDSEAAVEALESRRGQLEGEVSRLRTRLGELKSEAASLETLQKAALGDDDRQQQDWLHRLDLAAAQRLAQSLSVDSAWEQAVEQVLGRLLQAPVAPEISATARELDAAPERGAALVLAAPAERGQPGRLSGRVEAPPAVLALLASVHCADDAAAAEALLPQLGPGESVITPDGLWQATGWLRLPARGDGEGVIARARRLQTVQQALAETGEALQREEAALAALREELLAAGNERKRRAAALEAARSAASRTASEEVKAQQAFDLQRSRHEQLATAVEELRAEHEQAGQDCAALQEAVAGQQAASQRLQEERQALEAARGTAREEREAARQALQQASRTVSELQSRLAAAHGEAQAAAERASEFAARATQIAESLRERQAQPAQEAALAQAQEALRAAETRQEAARNRLAEARSALEAKEQAMAQRRQAEQKAHAALEQAQEALQEARVAFQGLDAQRQMLQARFAEFGTTEAAAAESLAEHLRQGAGGKAADAAEADAESWQAQLDKVQRRIERLGAINLAAIEELEETRTRAEELERQHADISEALETLEAAIRKIDRETRERFRTTFDEVNRRFSARFPRLFGGGEAALELTDDDLLSAGVRVMARPPGKRNTSIHLLSGGEKAMTAVALLLALFELNPAPFCLLDEVDAPLDDANVSRFCEVIREMSQSVQFVIITHNKITMALADHLHGVTMQEPGASRLVSVDVQQAVSLAGEAA